MDALLRVLEFEDAINQADILSEVLCELSKLSVIKENYDMSIEITCCMSLLNCIKPEILCEATYFRAMALSQILINEIKNHNLEKDKMNYISKNALIDFNICHELCNELGKSDSYYKDINNNILICLEKIHEVNRALG
jgi:hypothetical protein